MSKDVYNRPTVHCSNPHCGNTLYIATYGFDADSQNPKPEWECTNCSQRTVRHTRSRRTLAMKRWEVIDQLKAEWESTEKALHELLEAGKIKGGALLVHGFTFNYNVEALRKWKPSRWELRYHASQARKDLEAAKKFVEEAR